MTKPIDTTVHFKFSASDRIEAQEDAGRHFKPAVILSRIPCEPGPLYVVDIKGIGRCTVPESAIRRKQ